MSMPRSVSEFMTPATLPLLYNSVEAVDRDMHQNKRRQRSSGYAFAARPMSFPRSRTSPRSPVATSPSCSSTMAWSRDLPSSLAFTGAGAPSPALSAARRGAPCRPTSVAILSSALHAKVSTRLSASTPARWSSTLAHRCSMTTENRRESGLKPSRSWRNYASAAELARAFGGELRIEGLLDPIDVTIRTLNGGRPSFVGFFAIEEGREDIPRVDFSATLFRRRWLPTACADPIILSNLRFVGEMADAKRSGPSIEAFRTLNHADDSSRTSPCRPARSHS